MKNRKASITAILTIGTLVVIGGAALLSSLTINKKQSTSTRAAAPCTNKQGTMSQTCSTICGSYANYEPGTQLVSGTTRTCCCKSGGGSSGNPTPTKRASSGAGGCKEQSYSCGETSKCCEGLTCRNNMCLQIKSVASQAPTAMPVASGGSCGSTPSYVTQGACIAACGADGCVPCTINGQTKYKCTRSTKGTLPACKGRTWASEGNCTTENSCAGGSDNCSQCSLGGTVRYHCEAGGVKLCTGATPITCGAKCCSNDQVCATGECKTSVTKSPTPSLKKCNTPLIANNIDFSSCTDQCKNEGNNTRLCKESITPSAPPNQVSCNSTLDEFRVKTSGGTTCSTNCKHNASLVYYCSKPSPSPNTSATAVTPSPAPTTIAIESEIKKISTTVHNTETCQGPITIACNDDTLRSYWTSKQCDYQGALCYGPSIEKCTDKNWADYMNILCPNDLSIEKNSSCVPSSCKDICAATNNYSGADNQSMLYVDTADGKYYPDKYCNSYSISDPSGECQCIKKEIIPKTNLASLEIGHLICEPNKSRGTDGACKTCDGENPKCILKTSTYQCCHTNP